MKNLIKSFIRAVGLQGLQEKVQYVLADYQRDISLYFRTRHFRPDDKFVYKATPQGDLDLHVFRPKAPPPAEGYPAVVFFHGGGWGVGTARQFFAQCWHFASRGMVAVSVDYRTEIAHKTGPHEATADSISAVRWVRRNADKLSINPDQIAVGGGSVGGHMTAACTFLQHLAEPGEDTSVSSASNAMIFYNAVLDTTERGWGAEKLRVEDLLRFSPVHNLKPGLPPSIVLHGTNDDVTPYENAVRFTDEMKKIGNDCELFTYPDVGHGFFRYVLNRPLFLETTRRCDEFLVSIGFIEAPADAEDFCNI